FIGYLLHQVDGSPGAILPPLSVFRDGSNSEQTIIQLPATNNCLGLRQLISIRGEIRSWVTGTEWTDIATDEHRCTQIKNIRLYLWFIALLPPFLLQKCPLTKFGKGVAELLLGVHHDRTVPSDRLSEGFPGNQQETDAILARFHCYLVAAVKENQGSII